MNFIYFSMSSLRRNFERVSILSCSLFCVFACRHVATPETGQSSFRFVERPEAEVSTAAASVEPRSGEAYRDAKPVLPLVIPVYPAKALAAKAGMTVVGVHLTIDKEGRVTDIGPSLLAVSIPTRFDDEFQAAMRAAVRHWRFSPAQVYHTEVVTAPGGESYQRVTDQQNVEAAFDVAFTFTATGAVLGGVPVK
jgi:TonB family protein